MTIGQYIIEYGWITTIIGSLVVLVLYLHYWWTKSYFEEKGKNLATKEDIAEITQITEMIKSELDLISKNKHSLIEERRRVIIRLMDCIQTFEHFIRFGPDYLKGKNIDDDKADHLVYNYESIVNELQLYLDDEYLHDACLALVLMYKDAMNLRMEGKEQEYKNEIDTAMRFKEKAIVAEFKKIIRSDFKL